MSQLEVLRDSARMEGFDYPTLEEIVSLWRCYRSSGLAPEEAWNAIAAGLALGVIFSGRTRGRRVEQ